MRPQSRGPSLPTRRSPELKGLRYGRGVVGKHRFRVRERHVAEHLAPLISDKAAGAAKLIPDRIHPIAAIHLLMAEALLRAWNAPAVVTDE